MRCGRRAGAARTNISTSYEEIGLVVRVAVELAVGRTDSRDDRLL
jgi:hypothetical protein